MLKFFARLLPALSTLVLPLAAQSPGDLVQRMDDARKASLLNEEGLKPWRLGVSFDLLTPKGAVAEHGTFEELWASPDRIRRAFVSPGYTATEILNKGQTFRTAQQPPPPELLQVLQTQLEDPIPEKRDVEVTSPLFEKKTFSKVELECIMLDPPHTSGYPPLGLNPSFCFSAGQPSLRLFLNYGAEQVIRNTIGNFQGKAVALDIQIFEAGVLALRAHVDQLASFAPQDASFATMPNQEMVSRSADIESSVAAGRLLTKVVPLYPDQARAAHLTGAVALRATIDRTGHIQSLVPLRSPAFILTESAMKAVRQWTYEPYRIDGEPIEVRTTITVNYNMSR